ncbi:TetR/AcrR family transcriptional regulator [Rhodococcus sp. IEGM 1330]|uniref:TetR/AcrR family transcriptional regulator n=1 Tax=Rhodococcus sp. IEGM 1330 TaxID=3082225 RepID=UPI002953860D|nr:TetR/AcrR family transcriptional regulator [Rhodococcus sp. IEGM 1330]MDV8024623.1 TetR/AcrR family transcriptional regulator [Rhodococcus sp. IEGM 1330]
MTTNDELSARQRIMLAAIELADQQGTGRMTMSAVAARAKVSRPTLYSYFPDVSRILEAWVEQEVVRVEAQLQDVLDQGAGSDPMTVLGDYIDLQLIYFVESPTRALLTTAALGSPPQSVTRHIERFRADVHGLLSVLGRQGRLRADVDVEMLAGLVIAGITSMTRHVLEEQISPTEARRQLLDILFRGSLLS